MTTTPPVPKRCPCGQPLHYTDPRNQAAVETIIAQLGPTITVQAGGRSYQVPRHYIALHGLRARDLPQLARLHGWHWERTPERP